MSLQKCQKYLTKLSSISLEDDKFGLYLDKLNYWYNQYGGKANCDTFRNVAKCAEHKKECKWINGYAAGDVDTGECVARTEGGWYCQKDRRYESKGVTKCLKGESIPEHPKTAAK